MEVPDSVKTNIAATANSIRGMFPASYSKIRILELELWYWISLVAILFLALVAGFLITSVVVSIARRIVRRTPVTWDDVLLEKSKGPFGLAVTVLFFHLGSLLLSLPDGSRHTLATVSKIVAVLAVTWLGLRVADILSAVIREKLQHRNPSAASTLVPMGRRALKIVILVTAAVCLLQNVGFNITGLVAGLGVGGLAIALAAQKTIENLFGGMAVLADRPVKIGDACKVGEVQGTVMDIGLRSTRIRTLERSIVSIPNAEFSTSRIENLASKDRFRLLAVLPIDYAAGSAGLERLLAEFRRILSSHPKILPDPARARVIALGAYSIDVEVFAYVDTRDQEEFLAVREEIFLRLLDAVPRCGVSLAYPTRTVHLEGALPTGRGKESGTKS